MFVADLLVEFLLRLAIKFARRIGVADWTALNAIVASSDRRRSFTGCILVVIQYKYRNTDKRFNGTFKQPFLNDNYANAYLRRYPGGAEFPVLVNPLEPSRSIPAEGIITFTPID